METIDFLAGARPNFIKIVPIIDALKVAQTRGCGLHDSPLLLAGRGGGGKAERDAGQMEGKMKGLQPVDLYQFRHRLELGVTGDDHRVVSEGDGGGEGVCIGERITRFYFRGLDDEIEVNRHRADWKR